MCCNLSDIYFTAVPTPTVAVALSEGSTLYAGTNLSLICNIALSLYVDSRVSVNVKWLNGRTFLSNDSDRVSISLLSSERPLFTSTLLLSPLHDVDNSSSFICQASAKSESMFITSSGNGEDSITIPVVQKGMLFLDSIMIT